MMLPDCSVSRCSQCALRDWCDRPEAVCNSNLQMLIDKIKSIRDPNFKVT